MCGWSSSTYKTQRKSKYLNDAYPNTPQLGKGSGLKLILSNKYTTHQYPDYTEICESANHRETQLAPELLEFFFITSKSLPTRMEGSFQMYEETPLIFYQEQILQNFYRHEEVIQSCTFSLRAVNTQTPWVSGEQKPAIYAQSSPMEQTKENMRYSREMAPIVKHTLVYTATIKHASISFPTSGSFNINSVALSFYVIYLIIVYF